jgi:hypothetical protein
MTTPFKVSRTTNYLKCGLFCFVLLFTGACKKAANTKPAVTDTVVITPPVNPVNFPQPTYDPTAVTAATIFNTTPVVNYLARTDLVEISGVAASRVNPGLLYVHNDSGNPSQVYLTDGSGANKGTLDLTGLSNRDWEDIAVGPGPVDGKSYVYVADIGDNDAKYQTVLIYRFMEPDLTGKTLPVALDITAVDILEMKYPDGPRNAETLMVDPLTKAIYIVSKESGLAKIYMAAYPQSSTTITTLSPVAKLQFNKATGGDIAADGTEMLLRNKEQIWYWKIPVGTSVTATFLLQPPACPIF